MMSVQARKAALELQQGLIELNIDVSLKVQRVQQVRSNGSDFVDMIAMSIDLGDGITTCFYIKEDGLIIPNKDSWYKTFQDVNAWSFEHLPPLICARLPTLKMAKLNFDRMLKAAK